MSPLETARAALGKGDITAVLGLADALCDEGHPDAEELVSLAVCIASTTDWAEAMLAGTVFLAILEKGEHT
jgi:hypothetical protein